MNKLLLAGLVLAIAFMAFMPVLAFAKEGKTNQQSNSRIQEFSTVSRVEGRDGGNKYTVNHSVKVSVPKGITKITVSPVKAKSCQKNCVNGANKTIVKNFHAKCGKAVGKKTKVAEQKHVCTAGCHQICTHANVKYGNQKDYGYGYGHSKNEHSYNGYGYGHCKHGCGVCKTNCKLKGIGGGIINTIVPTASAQSASSLNSPTALPEAGAGVLLQVIAFLSSLFGVWGVRKYI